MADDEVAPKDDESPEEVPGEGDEPPGPPGGKVGDVQANSAPVVRDQPPKRPPDSNALALSANLFGTFDTSKLFTDAFAAVDTSKLFVNAFATIDTTKLLANQWAKFDLSQVVLKSFTTIDTSKILQEAFASLDASKALRDSFATLDLGKAVLEALGNLDVGKAAREAFATLDLGKELIEGLSQIDREADPNSTVDIAQAFDEIVADLDFSQGPDDTLAQIEARAEGLPPGEAFLTAGERRLIAAYAGSLTVALLTYFYVVYPEATDFVLNELTFIAMARALAALVYKRLGR